MSDSFCIDMMTYSRVVRLDGRDFLYGLLDFIRRARQRIFVTQFIIDADPRHDTAREVRCVCHRLAEARWRGVDVRILLNPFHAVGNSKEYNYPAADFLTRQGVTVRWYVPWEGSSRNTSHSKYSLFDDDITIVSSHNFTSNAFRSSYESAYVVRSEDLTMLLASSFEHAWERGNDDMGLN